MGNKICVSQCPHHPNWVHYDALQQANRNTSHYKCPLFTYHNIEKMIILQSLISSSKAHITNLMSSLFSDTSSSHQKEQVTTSSASVLASMRCSVIQRYSRTWDTAMGCPVLCTERSSISSPSSALPSTLLQRYWWCEGSGGHCRMVVDEDKAKLVDRNCNWLVASRVKIIND